MSEPKYITIAPEWPMICRMLLDQIAFKCSPSMAVSILEIVRYLQVFDPDELKKIHEEFDKREKQNRKESENGNG